MELVSKTLAIFDLSLVFTSTIPGLIGKEGDNTLLATSKFDFINSNKNTKT